MRSGILLAKKVYQYIRWANKQPFHLKRHFALIGAKLSLHCIQLTWLKHRIKTKAPDRELIVIGLVEHLGDIVACEPVSRYVRQQYPQAYIVWCTRNSYRELIDNNPNVDKTLVVHCLTEWKHLVKSGLSDRVIDLHIQGCSCPVCNIALIKEGTDIDVSNYFNFGSLLSSFSRSAGLPALHEQPKVYIPQSIKSKVDAYHLPDKFVVIHCASNDTVKDWQTSKWHELICMITRGWGLDVVEVGMASAMDNTVPPNYINLCGKLSILETAEVIKRSQLFIGVDSGPAHLANAVGKFGIILLGHYVGFKRYMPFTGSYRNSGGAELIHQNGPAADIPIERVYQAISKRLSSKGP